MTGADGGHDRAGAVDHVARRLAVARVGLGTAGEAGRSWDQLPTAERHDAEREAGYYLRAAATAGIAVAVIDDDINDDDDRDAARPRSQPRVTATIRGVDGHPLGRDVYASHLQARADRDTRPDQRVPVLSAEEAEAVADLLDELAGVYRDEHMGRLARELAGRLYDRLGI